MQTDTDHVNLVATYFNAHATEWHDYYHHVKTVNDVVLIDRTKIAVGFVQKYVGLPGKVLDAGCGAGLACVDLAQKGFFVHGIDLAQRMVDLCTENLSQRGIDPGTYTVTVGNILETDLPARSFDAIVALGFLQYQSDEQQAVTALSNLLKPGGILVLSGPAKIKISNFFGLPGAAKRLIGRLMRKSEVRSSNPDVELLLKISVGTYTISRFAALAEKAGLKLIEYNGHGYVHFRFMGRRLSFQRELTLHQFLTKLARVVPVGRFANDLVVVLKKPA